MKKTYQKPLAELIDFVSVDDVMSNMGELPGFGGEGGGSYGDDFEWEEE